MNITTVIPVRGRLPLLDRTLRRLREQIVPINNIVVVGERDDEFDVAMNNGARFVKCPNHPLGRKWQVGLQHARKAFPNTDFYFHTGSDEWFTNGYTAAMIKEIGKCGMVGMREYVGLHINSNGVMTGCLWDGFHQKSRRNEAVGSGRIMTRATLDRLKWEVVDPGLDKNLDHSMMMKLRRVGIKTKTVSIDEPGPAQNQRIMAISCDLWRNKRNLSMMLRAGMVNQVKSETLATFLKSEFPEIYECKFFLKYE